MFGSFATESVGVRIERVVLQVLKQAAMILTRAALGGESDIAYLRKLCAVVRRRYSYRRDSLLRWIGVLQRAVRPHVRGRDAVDREVHHRRARTPQRNVARTPLRPF